MFLSKQRAQDNCLRGKVLNRNTLSGEWLHLSSQPHHHDGQKIPCPGTLSWPYPHPHPQVSPLCNVWSNVHRKPAHARHFCFENALQSFPEPVNSMLYQYVTHSPLRHEPFHDYPQQKRTNPLSTPVYFKRPGITQNTPECFLSFCTLKT